MPAFFRVAGPQDPIYGIHHTNITDRLTRRNWKHKAIVRTDATGCLYLWIDRGSRYEGRRKIYAYLVHAHPSLPRERVKRYEANFPYLKDALRYVNGEDEGLIARETSHARPGDVPPPEQVAPYFVGFSRPRIFTPRG